MGCEKSCVGLCCVCVRKIFLIVISTVCEPGDYIWLVNEHQMAIFTSFVRAVPRAADITLSKHQLKHTHEMDGQSVYI